MYVHKRPLPVVVAAVLKVYEHEFPSGGVVSVLQHQNVTWGQETGGYNTKIWLYIHSGSWCALQESTACIHRQSTAIVHSTMYYIGLHLPEGVAYECVQSLKIDTTPSFSNFVNILSFQEVTDIHCWARGRVKQPKLEVNMVRGERGWWVERVKGREHKDRPLPSCTSLWQNTTGDGVADNNTLSEREREHDINVLCTHFNFQSTLSGRGYGTCQQLIGYHSVQYQKNICFIVDKDRLRNYTHYLYYLVDPITPFTISSAWSWR